MTYANNTELLQSISNAVAELAERTAPSVVHIGSGGNSGTGIVWDREGHVVTASHVVGDARSVDLRLSDGRNLEAEVRGKDRYTDIALLKTPQSAGVPIAREQGSAKVGQFALALADVFGNGVSVTSGIVTSSGRSVRGWFGAAVEGAIITDAKLNPGYSGGPLIDATGKLLGMNIAQFAGRGVAVPEATLEEVVGSLAKDGRIKKGFLGVIVEPIELPAELAHREDVGQETGLLVRLVEPKSPARRAGVAMGDIVLKLGDSRTTGWQDLHKALSADSVGRTLSLWVLRGERLAEFKVQPEEAREH